MILVILAFFFNYDLKWYIVTALLVLLNGLDFSFTAWFNRNKEYKLIIAGRILRILSLNASIILLGLLKSDSFYIMLSNVIGLLILNGFLFVIFIKKYYKLLYIFSFRVIFNTLRNNLDFPRYSSPAGIVNILSAQSPIIILRLLFGEAIAGIYALVNRVMGAPSQLIAGATGEVYRQKASDEYNKKGNCQELFLRTFKGLFFIATIPFIIIIIFGPDLFSFLFGSEWVDSGYFARYLAIFFLLRFCVSPLSFTLIIANRQNYNFYWQIFLFINTTLGMICGYLLSSDTISIIAYSLIYSTMYLFYLKEIYYSAKGNLNHEKN